ncbi:MarR family winged helix-turn-helix transcriptional regulator [Intestinimonas butyriciproducens]|uniref:MarR family winged helix-turn-helix transcriptional regulator n=1 Tax=Intestinimonas butyriciproducens TaxID=1297617 RepID=UPI00195C45EA|nr:MarR family transcriptional regulator [Intestinimonas butyriciproducens]MBM6918944.1 MarR family transcriptional regulator [Intestinimonas butyriciproducens]
MREEEKKPLDLSEYGRTDLIFDFVSTYYERTNISRDYGTGDSYSMTEVHMLTRIADHPGITVTELSQRGNRTKSAISQVVKRLEEKGLVEKRKAADNGSRTLLYATPSGQQLSEYHKAYDVEHGAAFDAMLAKEKGEEAVEQFYEVLACMYNYMRRKRENSIREKCCRGCGCEEELTAEES